MIVIGARWTPFNSSTRRGYIGSGGSGGLAQICENRGGAYVSNTAMIPLMHRITRLIRRRIPKALGDLFARLAEERLAIKAFEDFLHRAFGAVRSP